MSATSRLSLLVSSLGLLCLGGPSSASDLKQPYRVKVVVHVERHPLLTDVFRKQMQRELGDGVQAALGALARVEATDSHPRLLEIRTQGLGRALDGYHERSDYHTHFVLIDFSGTHYQVQTRMHDGLTGLSSPVVRRGRTRDRAYVARVAGFLMERDLSLLGTVKSDPDAAGLVRLELKAGGLGDLGRWVKKGEVFRLVRGEGAGPAQVVDWAFLQVATPPADGVCECKLFSRFELSSVTGQRSAVGLRAVLLGTGSGPLRLRVLQQKKGGGAGPLEGSVGLQLRKNGFEGEESGMLRVPALTPGKEVDTSRYGAKGRFDRLAFVSVVSGETRRARFPVPVLDDRVTVLVVPATSEEGSLLADRVRLLLGAVRVAYDVQVQQFNDINELTAKPEQRVKALARVRQTLERLEKDYSTYTAERDEMKTEVAKLPPNQQPPPQLLSAIDALLKQIKSGEADLVKHVALLEKIEKEENDPKKKDWLGQLEQAKLLEKQGELGKAIAIYEKAPPEFQDAALKNQLAELKKLWEPKSPEHAKARKFIYEVWPGLDTPSLEARLKDAKAALAECEKVGDLLGPAKLLRGIQGHLARLSKELDRLQPEVNILDDKPTKLIQKLLPELQALDKAVNAYLEKNRPAK
jgi:hypothetical protein